MPTLWLTIKPEALKNPDKTMCPSSRAQPGAQLLGVRQADGHVAILPQPLRINEAFIEAAKQDAPAEQRFRFTNKCVETGCGQWTGSRCGVADKIVSAINQLQVTDTLPECAIRPQCRWYQQQKAAACKVCAFVITETSTEEWENRTAAVIN